MKNKIALLSICGLLLSATPGVARDQSNGWTPPDPNHMPRHGYWSTPEGKQAAVEIRYRRAQEEYDRASAQNPDLRTDAMLQQYQQLMVSYTIALANFGRDTGNTNPPLPVIEKRNLPLTDEQLKKDYEVVLKDYFGGIRIFDLGLAYKPPPDPPSLPPLLNKGDPEYRRYAEALQIDRKLLARFLDQVYAAAVRARQTPLPFPLQASQPAAQQEEEQRWCQIYSGPVVGRVPC